MKKCISFGNFSWKLIYLLFMSIVIFGDQYCFFKVWIKTFVCKDLNCEDVLPMYKDNLYYFSTSNLFDSIGYFLSIIPEGIRMYINYHKPEKKIKLRVVLKYSFIQRKDGKKSKLYLYLTALCLLVISSSITKHGSYLSAFPNSFLIDIFFTNTIIFFGEFIVICVISFWKFNLKVYFHQFVAIGINILGIVIAYIGNLSQEFFPIDSLGFIIPIGIVHAILMALTDILEKYIMHNKHISPYRLLLIEGSALFIVNLVYYLCGKEDYISFFNTLQGPNILEFLIPFIFLSGLVNIFRILIIKEYSPSHRIIPEIFVGLFVFLDLIIPNEINIKTTEFYLSFLFSYPIRLFACIMFTDMILLHFCNLDKDTIVEIRRRAYKDFNENNTEMNLIEQEIGEGDLSLEQAE